MKSQPMDTGDLRARLTLSDGRRVWRDGRGRYRSVATGRFIKRSEIENDQQLALFDSDKHTKPTSPSAEAQQRSQAHMLAAVRAGGHTADTPEDAWGKLVGVQTEIALEAENGTKATSAAKLVAQATGLLDEEQTNPLGPLLEIMRLLEGETAQAVLAEIEKILSEAEEAED